MKKTSIAKYLAEIGRKGGKKSRRKLTRKEARRMARRRWGKVATLIVLAATCGALALTGSAQEVRRALPVVKEVRRALPVVKAQEDARPGNHIYLINPALPHDQVEVAPWSDIWVGKDTWLTRASAFPRPPNVPPTYVVVQAWQNGKCVGWVWMDAQLVNELHELDRPVEAPRVSL